MSDSSPYTPGSYPVGRINACVDIRESMCLSNVKRVICIERDDPNFYRTEYVVAGKDGDRTVSRNFLAPVEDLGVRLWLVRRAYGYSITYTLAKSTALRGVLYYNSVRSWKELPIKEFNVRHGMFRDDLPKLFRVSQWLLPRYIKPVGGVKEYDKWGL